MTFEELPLHEVFETQFRALQRVFPVLADLRAGVGFPSLVFAKDSAKLADIRRGPSAPIITVYDGCLKALQQELELSGATLRDFCLDGVAPELAREASRAVIEGLFDFSAAFFLAHECQHYAGGHLAAFAPRNLAFDEAAFGMAAEARSQSTHRRIGLRERYFLEHESDAVGLQTLMQGELSPQVRTLSTLLSETGEGVDAVWDAQDGLGRLVLFRMVVAALWLTVGVLEQRHPGERENVTSHPLPGARLLAGLGTVLEQFAELRDDPRDANGMHTRVLSETDAVRSRSFIRHVVQPIVMARLVGVTERDGLLKAPELALLLDLGRLFGQEPPQTAAGLELLEVQRLHPRMTAALKSCRLGR